MTPSPDPGPTADLTIVVAVHGATSDRLGALQRARRLASRFGGTALAYRGNRGVDVPDVAGVEVLNQVGRHGVEAALERCAGSDRVLHVHDDARVRPADVEALLACHARHGGVVVPYSNDDGMDHYAGSPDTDTIDRPARVVRSSCLLGRAERVGELRAENLSHPAARVRDVHGLFTVAGGAHVTHASACRESAPWIDLDGRPLLVASMIVRDEADTITACLESIASLVDRVDVLDTGSTDDTVRLARAAGARVRRGEWHDDFARARNEALDMSRDAWFVLHIDADERLVVADPDTVRTTLLSAIDHYDAMNVELTNLDHEHRPTTSIRATRILSPNGTRWVGAIHERPVADDGSGLPATFVSAVTINHLGYQAGVMRERDKPQRNLMIAEAAYAEKPSSHNALHLLRSLGLADQDPQRRIALGREILDEDMPPAALAHARTQVGLALLELGRPDEAFAEGETALDLVPADDFAANLLALAALELDDLPRFQRAMDRRDVDASVLPWAEAGFLPGLAATRVRALAGAGRLEEAVSQAHETLDHDALEPELWDVLLAAHATRGPDEFDNGLVPLVARDPSGQAIRRVTEHLRRERYAGFCAAYCEAGGDDPHAVTTGLLASMLDGRADLLDRLRRFAYLVEPETIDAIAHRLREKGYDEAAAGLTTRPAVTPAPPKTPIPATRYIFSINSGRAGSKYLAQLLGSAPGTTAYHEAPPFMAGEHLHAVSTAPMGRTTRQRSVKVRAINDLCEAAGQPDVYIETNHMFIKTFHDVVLDAFGDRVQVVVLRRNVVDVLHSFIQLGYFAPDNDDWQPWMLDPRSPRAVRSWPFELQDQYDLAIAYLFEIEARARAFIGSGVARVVEANLEDLQDTDQVRHLFDRLGLRFGPATKSVLGVRANARTGLKRQLGNDASRDESRRRLTRFVERARSAGLDLPRVRGWEEFAEAGEATMAATGT